MEKQYGVFEFIMFGVLYLRCGVIFSLEGPNDLICAKSL
jgi:hypothetical protein